MTPRHFQRTSMLALLAGSAAFSAALMAANSAAAASPCFVPLDGDPVKAAALLEDCIKKVNLAQPHDPTPLVFEGPQVYQVDKPLEITGDMFTDDTPITIEPGPNFEGDSLVIVGCEDCNVETTAEISRLHLGSAGIPEIRGIELRATHHLILDDPYLADFNVTGDGACIRAGQESSLDVTGGLMRECVATGDGGAIFSEATATSLDGTLFQVNAAANGGAISIGSGGTLSRALIVAAASFEDNFADFGGGVHATGSNVSANLSDSEFSGNAATQRGGGWFGNGNVSACVFEGNSAGRFGGAAFVDELTTIINSTFNGNDAYRGGALAVLSANNADVHIEQSTISNNTAKGSPSARFPIGGGIYVGRPGNQPTASVIRIVNSTLSANVVDQGGSTSTGGGLGVQGVGIVMDHVTAQGNEATSGAALFGSGGSPDGFTLRSSIVAGSSTAACQLSGVTVQTDSSLDDDGSCGVALSGVDPQLGPLADNGGPTWTHLPAAAVFGTATCYSTKDQRGVARPATACDVGSVQQ